MVPPRIDALYALAGRTARAVFGRLRSVHVFIVRLRWVPTGPRGLCVVAKAAAGSSSGSRDDILRSCGMGCHGRFGCVVIYLKVPRDSMSTMAMVILMGSGEWVGGVGGVG